jgi:hypothetical protein
MGHQRQTRGAADRIGAAEEIFFVVDSGNVEWFGWGYFLPQLFFEPGASAFNFLLLPARRVHLNIATAFSSTLPSIFIWNIKAANE